MSRLDERRVPPARLHAARARNDKRSDRHVPVACTSSRPSQPRRPALAGTKANEESNASALAGQTRPSGHTRFGSSEGLTKVTRENKSQIGVEKGRNVARTKSGLARHGLWLPRQDPEGVFATLHGRASYDGTIVARFVQAFSAAGKQSAAQRHFSLYVTPIPRQGYTLSR